MPSKSDKQHRLMEAVKHNAKFAKKVGIPQSVGRDYVAADKRTGRYARGGSVLKALSGARMRPIPDVRDATDELRSADRAIENAGKQIRRMRKAKGGKVNTALEALKAAARAKIAEFDPSWSSARKKTHENQLNDLEYKLALKGVHIDDVMDDERN